jgi:hypothetical protein
MKPIILFVSLLLALPGHSASKRPERKSLLETEPGVVYLEHFVKQPIELTVIKEAPVFSDKEGRHRLGTLKADQNVKLEAVTDKTYRVRGQGKVDGIAGWVAPWAFSSKDPQFVQHLKEFYDRQIQVQAMIDAKTACPGMTPDEVTLALGKPVKTSARKTEKGESGVWEYVEYKEIKHYVTRTDPATGQVYRQFSHITREEKSRTNVEFVDGLVSAVEESENRRRGEVRIIVPPVIFGW